MTDTRAQRNGTGADRIASRSEDTSEKPDQPDLSEANLVATLSDPDRRAHLLTLMRREQGNHLPLTNHYEALAASSAVEPEVLRDLANLLLETERIELLSPLVLNRSMPDDVLLRLCHEGKCIDALGHRQLPRTILMKVVELHEYPEAVLTLALDLYSDSAVTTEEFAAFLSKRTSNDWMLRALAGGAPSNPSKERTYWEALAHNPESSAVRTVLVALLEEPTRATEDFAEVLGAHASEAWTLEALLLVQASEPAKETLVLEACDRHADCERLREVRRFAHQIRRAGSEDLTSDEALKLHATNAPEILVQLAGNPRTPEHLLSELCEVRGTPKARRIRRQAGRTLQTKRKTT